MFHIFCQVRLYFLFETNLEKYWIKRSLLDIESFKKFGHTKIRFVKLFETLTKTNFCFCFKCLTKKAWDKNKKCIWNKKSWNKKSLTKKAWQKKRSFFCFSFFCQAFFVRLSFFCHHFLSRSGLNCFLIISLTILLFSLFFWDTNKT